MEMMRRSLQRFSVITATSLVLVSSVSAAPGELAKAPLFLSNPVKPNLILTLDNSVSMDYELSMPTSDGALWWNTNDKSFIGRDEYDQLQSGRINVNESGYSSSTWKEYTYLFPNGYSSTYNGKRMLADGGNGDYAVPPLDDFAYARSPDYNKSYYNPAVTYSPWPSYGGYTFGDANPAAAPYDPTQSTAGSLNLTQEFDSTSSHWGNSNWEFEFYPGMPSPPGGMMGGGMMGGMVTTTTLSPVAYFPATYYLKAGTADNTGYSADPSCSACKAPDGSAMDKYEIKPGNYSSSTAYQAAIQNFANWFTYYRRRHLAMRGAVAQTLNDMTATRVGAFTTNYRTNVTMYDLDNAQDKTDLFHYLYNAVGNYSTSPNRDALAHAGYQFQRTDSSAPIQYSCQQNATLLATDGYADTDTPWGLDRNYDGHDGTPYADGVSGTLGDIATNFYKQIGNTHSTNVPVDSSCSMSGHAPWLDCNTSLHMDTYGLSTGGAGLIYGNTHNSVEDAYTTTPPWRSQFYPDINHNPTQVDDLYHATVDGHGEIFTPSQTDALASRLSGDLNHMAAVSGSVAAPSFSDSTLTSTTDVYLPSFNSAGWSGDLKAWKLNRDGSIGTQQWSAADLLNARSLSNNPRSIITYNTSTSSGVPFEWDSLSTAMKNDLRTDSDGTVESNNTKAQQRLQFLRGDRSCEWGSTSGCSTTATLRKRSSILGDIIHSSAVYVGQPNQYWPATSPFPTTNTHQSFVDSMASRTGMLYVGSNDGMLHAFNASNGQEQFAYVPAALSASGTSNSGLHYLTQNDYQHRNYVDSTPAVSDAYLNGSWKTVLVGGLRGGGRGIYALDITSPDTMNNENTAAGKVMWEFTNPDLGYSFGQPVIAPLSDSNGGIDWYVIVANGYNAPGGGSNDGQAQLFIIKLSGPGSDGVWDLNKDYYVVPVGPESLNGDSNNGLSAPQVVDYTGDYIADRVYAGDLFGNLWAFDLRNGPANVTVKKLFTTIGNQPITTKPAVAYNPNMPYNDSTKPNLLVMFGSGQYLTQADKQTSAQQYLYGIWDKQGDLSSATTITTSDLVNQEKDPISVMTANSTTYRVMPDPQAVPYADPNAPKLGWYLLLPDKGERMITDPLVLGSVIYYVTTIPSQSSCTAGVSGWLMGLDLATGARTAQSIFDTNHDYHITSADKLSVNGSSVVASGEQQSGTLPQSLANLDSSFYTTNGNGGVQNSTVGDGSSEDSNILLRQSWRQLSDQVLQ